MKQIYLIDFPMTKQRLSFIFTNIYTFEIELRSPDYQEKYELSWLDLDKIIQWEKLSEEVLDLHRIRFNRDNQIEIVLKDKRITLGKTLFNKILQSLLTFMALYSTGDWNE